jgi:hypothetical protein
VFVTGVYMVVALLLPASTIFSLKVPLLVLVVLTYIFLLTIRPESFGIHERLLVRTLAISSFVLIYGAATIMFSNSELSRVTFLMLSFAGLIIGVVLSDAKVEASALLSHSTVPLSIAVLIIATSGFVGDDARRQIEEIFLQNDSGYLGLRSFGDLQLTMIHFRSSPILIVPATFYFKALWDPAKRRRKGLSLVLLVVTVAAILLSASRGLVLFTFLALLLTAFSLRKLRPYRLALWALMMAGFLAMVYLTTSTNVFSSDETSNSVKTGHLLSFIKLFPDNIMTLLFGSGFAATYYSQGVDQIVWQTELTFLDILRYFGIFGTLLFSFLMFAPLAHKPKFLILVPYVMYFADAMTNPLLFNSTGMLVVACYWVDTLSRSKGDQCVAVQ